MLQRAVHRSKREVEKLVAELSPQADVPAVIRKLPERLASTAIQDTSPSGTMMLPVATHQANAAPPATSAGELCPDGVHSPQTPPGRGSDSRRFPEHGGRSDSIRPIAEARYKVQFTASGELREKLERLRALMRSSVPDGDLAALIEDAVTETLARLETRKFANTERPRTSSARTGLNPVSRHIPAAIRRAVADRDGAQCAYRDEEGRRCSSRDRLEFHHRRPYGFGGDHSIGNVALLCPTHNRFLSQIDYGTTVSRGRPRPAPTPPRRRWP